MRRAYHGEIYVLYVLPQNQNQGIGRRLVAACVQHLIQQLAVETLLIWVIAENPYRRFYESLGGRTVREKTKEIGGKMISEVGYGWEAIHKLAILQPAQRQFAADSGFAASDMRNAPEKS